MRVEQSLLEAAACGGVAEDTVVDMVEGGVGFQQETQQDLAGVAASAKQKITFILCAKWVGLHITSMAIATAAALHLAMYSSVLGVPLYTPSPDNSATPVYSPCQDDSIIIISNQLLYGGYYLGITMCVHFNWLVTIDTGNMLQFSYRTV